MSIQISGRVKEIHNKMNALLGINIRRKADKFKLDRIGEEKANLWAGFINCSGLELGSEGEKDLDNTGSSGNREGFIIFFNVMHIFYPTSAFLSLGGRW